MRSNFPNLMTDRIVTSLRWLALLALTIAVAVRAPIALNVAVLLGAAAAWNILLTALAVINRRLPNHEVVSMAMDLLIAMLLFFLTGGIEGGATWSGVLPLVTATLYYQVQGVLFMTLLNLISQGSIALRQADVASALIFIAFLLPLYLIVGLVFSFLYARFSKNMQAAGNSAVTVQRDNDQIEQERRQAIYKLISALSATLNYQRVLETALDLSASTLSTPEAPADKLISAVLLFRPANNGQTEMEVASARRFTASDMRITLPGTEGLIGRAIDEAESTFTKEAAKDPELVRVAALHACHSAYCIPLRTGMDTCGVMLFAHPEEDFFTAERREILDIVGNQLSIAIQNARLYQDIEKEKERIMDIQEEARRKIARDLHDGPTQSVSAIAMRINYARRLMERDPKASVEELFKIEEMARQTTKEIRHMLFTLRPLVLESQGLVAALESMAVKVRETYQQNVLVQADPRLAGMLEASKQGVIFYIVEEAVTNARKHAKAEHIWVRLKTLREDVALLEVEDDGVGFNAEEITADYEDRGSLGMINMRERAELVNGVLEIQSAVGKGTLVQMAIPLTEEAADLLRRGQ